MTLNEHARETLIRLCRGVEEQIGNVMADPGVDPVHDLRVAIRRFSQALRAFAGLLPGKEGRRMRRALKPALDAAAEARDLDVGMELLEKEGLAQDHALISQMRAERGRAVLALTGQLYLLRAKEVPAAFPPAFDALRETMSPASGEARALLPPLCDDFFKAGRKTALKTDSPQRLHAFRLAAKRFRYTLELFRPFYGPVFQKRLEQVHEIQNLLGKRQDCSVMSARLQPLSAIDEALAAVLIAVESRGKKLESEFRRYWHDVFDAEGEALKWRRYLARRQAMRTSG